MGVAGATGKTVTAKMATPLSRDSKLSDAHLESLKRREGGEGCH